MPGGISSIYFFPHWLSHVKSWRRTSSSSKGLYLDYNLHGEISRFSALRGLKQNSLELWSYETEKDEDQGKVESSRKQAAEVEICYCFVLYLI